MLIESDEIDIFDIELPIFEDVVLPTFEDILLPDLGNIKSNHQDLPDFGKLPPLDYENSKSEFEDPYETEEDDLSRNSKDPYEVFSYEEEREIVSFIFNRRRQTPTKKPSIDDQFSRLVQTRAKDAQAADEEFLTQLCNIQNYEFHPMRLKPKCIVYKNWEKAPFRVLKLQVKAVIDFMKLEFTSNVATSRIKVKEILTKKTGTKFYTQADESNIEQDGQKFTIILHDINDRMQLKTIADLLVKHFHSDVSKLKVKAIELSVDFYNAQNNALLIALFKALRLDAQSDNFRIYKNQKGFFSPVIQDPLKLLKHIDDDWCIGINHRDSPLYYRLYHKTTDRNSNLSKEEHRHRIEVNLNGKALENIDCHPYNLQNVVKYGFRKIQFTVPSFDSHSIERVTYETTVQPFGMEADSYSQANHRKRALPVYLKPHTQLNRLIRKAVDNLCRKL